MEIRTTVELDSLCLPDTLSRRLSNAPLYESSGASGARTLFADSDGGMYLKIAERDSLKSTATMQAYFARKGIAPPVLDYAFGGERDYLLSAALPGLDGTHPIHLAEPARLCRIFGEALRALHEIDASDCPVPDRMRGLLDYAQTAPFRQDHLDAISASVGDASADEAAAELRSTRAPSSLTTPSSTAITACPTSSSTTGHSRASSMSPTAAAATAISISRGDFGRSAITSNPSNTRLTSSMPMAAIKSTPRACASALCLWRWIEGRTGERRDDGGRWRPTFLKKSWTKNFHWERRENNLFAFGVA